MYQEIVNAHQAELRALELRIKHRMEWSQLLRIDRLEGALRVARRRVEPALGALKTNN